MPDSASSQPARHPDDFNPCLDCGACCANFRVSFYCGEVTGANGGTVPEEFVTPVTPLLVCMRGTERGGRCTALRGVLGKPGIHCAIYPLRSSTCREFNAWEDDGSVNPVCQRLRSNLGLPPLEPRPTLP